MRKYILTILIAIVGISSMTGQVVMREFLSQNHSGTLAKSSSLNGRPMKYEFVYKDMVKGNYNSEGEAIERINYELNLYDGSKKVASLPVVMRDLIVTLFIEIPLTFNNDTRTLMGLYQKQNRWLKIKVVLPAENMRVSGYPWERIDEVKDFQTILNQIVSQMDKNIKLEKYFNS